MIYFTGDFGGMFGLLLGGSMLSVVEVVDLLLYNFVLKLAVMKRVTVTPRPHQISVQSTTSV